MKPPAQDVLREAAESYAKVDWDAGTLKASLIEIGERHGLKLAKAHMPVRVAVTGRSVGPPLFEALEVLGREPTLARIQAALDRLTSAGPADG
jgi:glutamyl-tRNA synthetase